MSNRLLNLLDPEDLNRSTRTAGWIAGELVGVMVAAAVVLFLLIGLHVG
ncbi:MAG TPA: hypothetical protein VH391_07025 [Solirubrobacterales bacterium]|jgi:hypothetical protein